MEVRDNVVRSKKGVGMVASSKLAIKQKQVTIYQEKDINSGNLE